MSNTAVGMVYQAVIEDVISASRVDFEEGGVEEIILEELRKGWQKKLSQLNVATFPWDPKPEPANSNNASASTPAPAQNNMAATAGYTQARLSPPPNTQALPLPDLPLPSISQQMNGPAIKTEPGLPKEPTIKQEPNASNGPMPPTLPAFPGGPVSGNAAARAVQQLQNTYGQRAAASINAIHSGMAQAPQGAPRANGPVQQPINAQQYRAQVAAQQQQQAGIQMNGANGVANSQVDGAGDLFEGVMMRQGPDGQKVELGRVEIDVMLHEQMAMRAKQMEGGGLMLPLQQATKHKSAASKKAGGAGVSQVDGIDDDMKDEDFDEDAINSDLDDPEDEQDDDDDDDDAMGPIMLCMYDKVQRVKNKWKCTLKDGVLTVNGREYVFHKATGEYEW